MIRQEFITLLCCLGAICCLASEVQAASPVTIVYLQDGMSELQKTEKQVALQLWVEEMAHEGDLEVEVLPVATVSRLVQLIKLKKVNYVIINSVHYLKHGELKEFFKQSFWAVQRSNTLYEEYVIVSRKQNNIKGFKQLPNTQLSIAHDGLLMHFYLNYLALKAGYPASKRIFKKIRNTHTASQAVLDVYFGKSDVCIVPRHILNMAVELNPSIMERLNIAHRSGDIFIPVLIIGTTNTPDDVSAAFADAIEVINASPRGEQIINLFKINSIVRIQPEKLAAMSAIYTEFQRLERRR